jgi:hypothetical protein
MSLYNTLFWVSPDKEAFDTVLVEQVPREHQVTEIVE